MYFQILSKLQQTCQSQTQIQFSNWNLQLTLLLLASIRQHGEDSSITVKYTSKIINRFLSTIKVLMQLEFNQQQMNTNFLMNIFDMLYYPFQTFNDKTTTILIQKAIKFTKKQMIAFLSKSTITLKQMDNNIRLQPTTTHISNKKQQFLSKISDLLSKVLQQQTQFKLSEFLIILSIQILIKFSEKCTKNQWQKFTLKLKKKLQTCFNDFHLSKLLISKELQEICLKYFHFQMQGKIIQIKIKNQKFQFKPFVEDIINTLDENVRKFQIFTQNQKNSEISQIKTKVLFKIRNKYQAFKKKNKEDIPEKKSFQKKKICQKLQSYIQNKIINTHSKSLKNFAQSQIGFQQQMNSISIIGKETIDFILTLFQILKSFEQSQNFYKQFQKILIGYQKNQNSNFHQDNSWEENQNYFENEISQEFINKTENILNSYIQKNLYKKKVALDRQKKQTATEQRNFEKKQFKNKQSKSIKCKKNQRSQPSINPEI